MNSRVPWSVEGIDPSVRERAEAAARRAGMSLNEWLNSTIGDSIPPDLRNPVSRTSDVADIHQQLDSITRQIEQISRGGPRGEVPREQGVVRQLSDAISRLDARLSQISNPQNVRQAQERHARQAEAVERAATQVYPAESYPSQAFTSQGFPSQTYQLQAHPPEAYRGSPPLSPELPDFPVAEIAVRQSEPEAPRAMPPLAAPPIAPAPAPSPDFAALERHLFKITGQIEALQRPDQLEQSITAFRNELAEIRAAITEAMPRQAIESIESDIRSLTRRIEENRQGSIDDNALANIEQALSEIREVLRTLMPAEQLKGYDEAIFNLGAKLDVILRANDNPAMVRQLEGAISALRAIVANVASDEALGRLSDDVHLLSSKVDQLVRAGDNSDSLAALEQRIAALTAALESRNQPVVNDRSEQIEGALRALSERIDHLRLGSDHSEQVKGALRALSDRIDHLQLGSDHSEQIKGTLRRLSDRIDQLEPGNGHSEQIEGAFRALSDRIDSLRAGNDHSGQIEGAFRALSERIDSLRVGNDHSERIESAFRALSDRIDSLRIGNDHSERIESAFRALSDRIDGLRVDTDHYGQIEGALRALSDRIDGLRAGNGGYEQIEDALRALSDRIDHLQDGNDSTSALAHLEQRVSFLLERVEASGQPSGDDDERDLLRVEEGLQDVLRHLERQHAAFANFAADRNRDEPELQESELIDLVKRELSEMRFSQTKTDRHTQDSLEVVHSTLGHVVDRLAMIEGDLRTVRSASPEPVPAPAPASPPAAEPPPAPVPAMVSEPIEPQASIAPIAPPPQEKPDFAAMSQSHFDAAPREFHAAEPPAPLTFPAPPPAISEILVPRAAPAWTPVASDLPPDHPLEPGTRPSGHVASPSERIAASENVISEIPAPATPRPPVSTASFIAAARRAAQAAAAQPVGDRGTPSKAADKSMSRSSKEPSTIGAKIRSLLVAASVVVIVLGGFKMAMGLLESGVPPQPSVETSSETPSRLPPPPPDAATMAPVPSQVPSQGPSPVTPSMTSPAAIGRQSMNENEQGGSETTASVEIPLGAAAAAAPIAGNDITAAVPAASTRKDVFAAVPPNEHLPDGIGGPALRAAVLRGDPAAVYEVGARFAEGRGVPQNLDEAVKWYDRAAQAGIVPAIFRLGTFYEKGLGVKKDVDIARRYYEQAAERGNAKAMHNIAVLDADGGGKAADYKSAAQWFRKAAEHGVADSQFNLGILYARGIGVEQNLAESFKWFSLAAAQGDADAAQKRDDIAKRLDAQSLAAARLAIQTFMAEPQPDDAVNVATPPGGWDSAPPQASATKPPGKPAPTRRASR